MRPDRRSFTAFAAALVVFVVVPLTVLAADVFTDVPDANVHHDDITWLEEAGVTLGCNPPSNTRFCPDDDVTRAQMASFLRRLAENEVVEAATANEADHAAAADTAPGTLLSYHVIDATCPTSLSPVTPTYQKVLDVGTFETVADDSLVAVTFNGRVFVGDITAGSGAVFELRVDDAATTVGRARINLRTLQEGGSGVQGSMKGMFPGLARGEHVVSIWVRTSSGGAGTQAMIDPGCWSTDSVVVEEYAALSQ